MFSNKKAIVKGSVDVIGLATAKALARGGASVLAVDINGTLM